MDGPLKVLHVVVNMNRGGAETLIMNLYRNIDRTKIQFDFLTCKPGAFDTEILNMGGKIHRIPYITDVGHFAFNRELNRFFKENQAYKVVHAHMDKMSGFVLRAAGKANIPVRIAHSHNTESEGGMLAKIYKWYAGTHILSSATNLYACSNQAARWLFKDQANNAYIFKNGIETKKFAFSANARKKIRNELQLGEDTLVLGHVGRFSQQKNHQFLLDVFAEINQTNTDVELVLAGDGPLRQEAEERIGALQLEEKVRILGVRADIHQLLQAFDVFMMPSFHEGLPVTLIEAQCAGLPCLISDTITKEVDLAIGLVHYLSLSDQTEWKNVLIDLFNKEKQNRTIAQTHLAEHGYDIKEIAGLSESSYLMLGENML